MSDFEIGVSGFGILLLLLAVRIPIGVAMISVGMVGYVTIAGPVALLSYLKTETYWRFTSDILSVVPLFILMGQFAAKLGSVRPYLMPRMFGWDIIEVALL